MEYLKSLNSNKYLYLKLLFKLNQSSIVINQGRFFSEILRSFSKLEEAVVPKFPLKERSQIVLFHKTFLEDNHPILYLYKDNI